MKTTEESDTDHSAEVRVRKTDRPDSLSEDNRGGENDQGAVILGPMGDVCIRLPVPIIRND